jgi:hypothetical protein
MELHLNHRDPTPALQQIVVKLINFVPHGRNHTHACDHHPPRRGVALLQAGRFAEDHEV